MANIEQGKAKCYIWHKTHQELYISCKGSSSALSILLYFTLKEVLTKYTSLKFNIPFTHLLNKQMFL